MKFKNLEEVQEFFPCFKIGTIGDEVTCDVVFYEEDQAICVTSYKLVMEKEELEENEITDKYYQILNDKEYKFLYEE